MLSFNLKTLLNPLPKQEYIPVICGTVRGSGHVGGGVGVRHPPNNTPRLHTLRPHRPVDRMTHACETITFPSSLRYAIGNKYDI